MDADNRKKVRELRYKSILAEIYEKNDNGKVYYDFVLSRSFFVDGSPTEVTPYLQQRDIRNTVRLLMDLADWISEAHRNGRREREGVEERGE